MQAELWGADGLLGGNLQEWENTFKMQGRIKHVKEIVFCEMCRQSFEELILEDGELRWNRMENLLRESRKSMDFDASQLWLLLDWLVSDQGRSIRGPLASDLVRRSCMQGLSHLLLHECDVETEQPHGLNMESQRNVIYSHR